MTFGESLRRARKAKGHTQSDIAQALGLPVVSVCRIERGTYVNLTDEQTATLRATYEGLPPYFADPVETRRGLMAEMRGLKPAQALVVTSRKPRRWQAAVAAVELGEAYILRDETIYPTMGPEPAGGARVPYRRLFLLPTQPADESVI